MSANVLCLDDLPTEVLDLILSYLDVCPASNARRYEEPATTLADSTYRPLKNFSQTSHGYRSLSSPSLFKFSEVRFQESIIQKSDVGGLHRLAPLYNEVKHFLRFIVEQDLSQSVYSLVISTTYDVGGGLLMLAPEYLAHELGDLWTSIFRVIRPHAITISAPPSTLAFLTSCGIQCTDEWAFGMRRHTLQLRLSSDVSEINYPKQKRTNKLIDIIPWTQCILNEGSSIPVYNTYQYDAMIQPSVLNKSLRKDATLLLLTSIRSFDYVAIFPLIRQMDELFAFLFALPSLQRVIFQLAPQKQNKVLEDASRVQRSLYSDLWMELEMVFFFIATNVVHQPDCSINELICLDYQQEALRDILGRGGNMMSGHWRTVKDGHWKRIDPS
ncbi:hypothetical protein MMC18_003379 [Xylographa bjoerkii]|nr:hypothetical protein [Xylographa bjoerkii]